MTAVRFSPPRTTPPRATFTRIALRFMDDSAARSIRPAVPGVSGQCSYTTSDCASSSGMEE